MTEKIKKFLTKVLLIDLLTGLWVTLKYTFKPKVTYQYPEKVKPPRPRFRGILRLHRDAQGQPLCIACKMCQRACPENCFDIEGAKNEAGKMRPTRFNWKLERCTFCGLCVEACPTAAIRFSHEFRLSTADRRTLIFSMDQMYGDFDLQKHFQGEWQRP